LSTILITHDLGLAATYCDRVAVMEKGRVVETAPSAAIFGAPAHAYTKKLMRATPRPGVALADLLPEGDVGVRPCGSDPRAQPASQHRVRSAGSEPAAAPLLVVKDLVKEYPRKRSSASLSQLLRWRNGVSPGLRRGAGSDPVFRAVDGIGFTIHRGESVGLVGESGCGKSTTSTMVMRLVDATAGSILFDGQDIGAIPARRFARLPLRRRIQMVFQDPTDSLNPRFTAARAIADPILRLGDIRGARAVRVRCEELARQVGLPVELLDRFPHQLSGGQKARVGIARAVALNPGLVILDEPTAALDVSVQAVVLNLLQALKEELGMSYLFVSHDLHVVRLLCDRVIVMRAGRIVEEGPTERVMTAPQSDYTRELLAAVPHPPVQVGAAPAEAGG
jgi:peptide/nickel transport system ATP-binding protein